MKKAILTIIIGFFAQTVFCQTTNPDSLNLGFEKAEKGMPRSWKLFGSDGYAAHLDSTVARSGKYSTVIESMEEHLTFKAWGFSLPGNYAGKQITLSGYIKTEDVEDGYAGLWMRIDPEIAFDNMHTRGIKGTTDWTKYEITLEMDPANTTKIVIGGILVGHGKMWLDDLTITIDGKDIRDAILFVK